MVDPAIPTVQAPERRWFSTGSTPDRLRVTAVVVVVVIIAVGIAAWLLSDRLVDETTEVAESTGEVLIATQQLSASFAEADTAAVSVHLAGADGNREQRRLYEQATERATALVERVARLVGDDERSHDALQDIAAGTTRYVGLIEAARVASVENLAGADTTLSEGSALNRDEIIPDVQVIAERARARFDSQTNSAWYWVALILLVVAVAVLLASLLMLQRRFRRLINLPIALAALVIIGLLVLGARSFATQQQAFTDAEDQAFAAIVVSQEIQQNAYLHRATGTASVLTNREASAELEQLEALLGSGSGSGLLQRAISEADSPREVATAQEVLVRWERYVAESARIESALARGDAAEAAAITQGPANASFNGFNTTVEAALLDNREQFVRQLDRAADSLGWLREAILLGTLLAAVLTWWGFAQRIGEYR